MTIHQNGLFIEPGQGRSYYFGQDLYSYRFYRQILHLPRTTIL